MARHKKFIFSFITLVLIWGVIRLFDAALGVILGGGPAPGQIPRPITANADMVREFGEFRYHIRTNSLGLRSPEIGPPSDRPPVLFLGDSFVFGDGVEAEQTFVNVTQALLEKRGRRFLHVNGGIIFSNPWHALETYRRVKDAVKPRVVVLNLYSNDVPESAPEPIPELMAAQFRPRLRYRIGAFFAPNVTEILIRRRVKEKLAPLQADAASISKSESDSGSGKPRVEHIADSGPAYEARKAVFLKTLRSFSKDLGISAERYQKWEAGTRGELQKDIILGRVSTLIALGGLFLPDTYPRSLDITPAARVGYDTMMTNVDTLRREVQADGRIFLLTYLPADVQFSPEKQALYTRLGYVMRPEWMTESSVLEEKLTAYAKQNRIPFVSLTSAFRGGKAKLVFDFDLHWTPAGHRAAAEALTPFLNKHYPE